MRAALQRMVLAGVAALAWATASPPAQAETLRLDKSEDVVAGGQHWRIKTAHGPVHVWIPEGYDRATAGTVIYVHGYWTDVDGAWKKHSLPQQFKKSKQNAIFIVPDAPSSNDEAVKWETLGELRKAVTRANIRLPDGPTIVIGHSGAFRTITKWVDHSLLAQVILLDAMYGGQKAFDDFIDKGKKAQHHKLIVIGNDTASSSRDFAKKFPYAVIRDEIPSGYDDFTKNEKRSKLLYLRSQYSHSQLANGGKVLPLVLRLTPLAHL
jgi:hypothetical protein